MTIKRKLQLNGLITLILTLAMGGALFVTSQTVTKEFEKQKIAEQIVSEVTEQRSLSSEYVLYREDRPITQWYVKEQTLRSLFSSPIFQNPDEQKTITDLRDNLDPIDLVVEGVQLSAVVKGIQNEGHLSLHQPR